MSGSIYTSLLPGAYQLGCYGLFHSPLPVNVRGFENDIATAGDTNQWARNVKQPGAVRSSTNQCWGNAFALGCRPRRLFH